MSTQQKQSNKPAFFKCLKSPTRSKQVQDYSEFKGISDAFKAKSCFNETKSGAKQKRVESKESIRGAKQKGLESFSGTTFTGDDITLISKPQPKENCDYAPCIRQRRASWIRSSDWDEASCSIDTSDDTLYHILDDNSVGHLDSSSKKRLSLHQTLVEEELSFQRSLVWHSDSDILND